MSDALPGAFDLDWNLIRSFVAVGRALSRWRGQAVLPAVQNPLASHIQLLPDTCSIWKRALASHCSPERRTEWS